MYTAKRLGYQLSIGTNTISKDTGWSTAWTGLRLRDDSGSIITYRVEETGGQNGYSVTYAPGSAAVLVNNELQDITVTNTKSSTPSTPDSETASKSDERSESESEQINEYQTVNVNVRKVWNDGNNLNNRRPDHVKVHLLANGEDTGFTAELREDNGWFSEWYNLPLYNAEGSFITYEVAEEEVPGYRGETSGDIYGGYVITNSRKTKIPFTSDPFDSKRLTLSLFISMIMAMLSAMLLRKR